MDKNLTVEVCVDSVESAVAAQDAGAQRVELCDNLVEGGTTPSHGSIAVARELLNIGLHVIVRPRGGDFLYSSTEFEIMKRDIEAAKALGVDGVVFGILDDEGNIDRQRTAELVELSRPMAVTFHRAFDVCRDPFAAVETLIEIGVDRILTSGQEPTATAGSELIKQLIERAGSRITIMACGGLDEGNIASVIDATGAMEVHFAASETIPSGMRYRNERVAMGSIPSAEYTRKITRAEKVKEVIKAAS